MKKSLSILLVLSLLTCLLAGCGGTDNHDENEKSDEIIQSRDNSINTETPSTNADPADDSEQGVFAVSVGNQSAGTNITLKDKNGNTIISYAPELSFAVVILSSPDIVQGETYTIIVGENSGEFEAY